LRKSFEKGKKMDFSKNATILKRIFDILFSILVLCCLSPLFLLISLLVKISGPGPIFYTSRSPGLYGKIITYYKFRTMRKNADTVLLSLLQHNPDLKEEWTLYSKLKKDPRITSFGKFLRKTSLDELPQFFSVFKGDMSIVGPRPYLLRGSEEFFSEEIEKLLGNKAKKILSVRPGITGLWQISGRNELSYEERLFLEEKYANTHSLLLDFLIIYKTIPQIFFPKGAY
jgi:exopolysaccharide production protein ExoY